MATTLNDVLRTFFGGDAGDHAAIDPAVRALGCAPVTDLAPIADMLPRPNGVAAESLAWTTPFSNARYLLASRARAIAPGSLAEQVFSIRRVFLDKASEEDVARLVGSFGGRYAGNEHEEGGRRYALWLLDPAVAAVKLDGYRLFSGVDGVALLERISVSGTLQ